MVERKKAGKFEYTISEDSVSLFYERHESPFLVMSLSDLFEQYGLLFESHGLNILNLIKKD